MATRKGKRQNYEDRYKGSGTPLLIVVAVGLFGLAVLMLYIALASPTEGTAMGAMKNVLRGLGGSLSFAVPLILVWVGVLCLQAARGRRIPAFRVVCDALLMVCLFTLVHLFFAGRIRDERMTIISFTNFVDKSYSYGAGGGAIGAPLAWPLFQNLGVAGGVIAVVIIAVLLLTATGRSGRFINWFNDKLDQHAEAKEAREERREARQARREALEERRAVREQEHMFDTNARSRAAAKRGPSRDPFSESVLGGAGAASGAVKTGARTAAGRAARDGRNGSDGTGAASPGREVRRAAKPADAFDAAFEEGIQRSDTTSSRRDTRRPAKPAQVSAAPFDEGIVDIPDDSIPRKTSRRRQGEGDRPAQAPGASKGKKPAASGGRLYREDISGRASGEDEAAPKAGSAALPSNMPEDRLDDLMDDPQQLDAEAIVNKGGKGAARKGFKPDRPSRMEADASDEIETPGQGAKKAGRADKSNNVRLDDLLIQPDEYEKPDEEEAPAETVERGIAEKKHKYPKLKRASESKAGEEAPVYNYPPIDLLAQGEAMDSGGYNKRDMEKAQLLEDTLHSFGISSKLIGIAHGPAVTRFELQPAPGVKVSRITNLSDDIALNLAAMSVRIEAPIPGKAAVGVEIPNDKIEMVRLRDVLESQEARKHPSKIAVGLGKDNSGRYIVADIAKMPHVLIAGQTGSGKSVCINAIIASILFRASPEEVKLILIDPKVVELSIYNDIPHLVCPVVTDPKKAASALDWAVAEMSSRYKKFAERGVRDIKGYNKALKDGEPMMPQMVIIIDELADLMMVSPGEVEDSICRLAQLARACGMHLVIATQRPSVNVITGIIKANIPTRIAFSVASQVDSRTMIDHGGAEKLLGNGDMLFLPNGSNKPMRVQGAWVSDDEVHAIVEYIKASGQVTYDPDMLEHLENATRSDAEKEEFNAEYDPKLAEAVDIVLDMGQASISMLQRRMRIGYARAGRLIDEMAQRGIVSEADGAKPRVVLITREQANAMFED